MSLSKACVIAAINTQTNNGTTLDYIRLAGIAAERARYFLGVPVFLLTDTIYNKSIDLPMFDGVMSYKPGKTSKRAMLAGTDTITYEWHNDVRVNAYELTHGLADKILMIDADYMIGSDTLTPWLNTDIPFQIFNHAVDVLNKGSYPNKHFPSNDVIQRWATAMCWDSSQEAETIFETAQMVRDNYEFYALMLGMSRAPFRNDVAFSVACHLHSVPYMAKPQLFNLPADSYLFTRNEKESSHRWLIQDGHYLNLWDGDLHILNKAYAMDDALMNELRLTNVTA